MTGLLLHPKTGERIASFAEKTPHGVIITGPAGSGRSAVAKMLAANMLGVEEKKLDSYPYFMTLDPPGNSIKVEMVREELIPLLKLKVPGGSGIRRVILVPESGRMRAEAQNALLKVLEEPPEDTVIILIAESAEQLLNTVASRCQKLEIMPVSEAQAVEYFKDKGMPGAKIRSSYALSMGQAGLLNALLTGKDHALLEHVSTAKEVLGRPAGERLYMIDTDFKGKDKEEEREKIRGLLNALKRIIHAALAVSGSRGQSAQLKQWVDRENAVLEAQENLAKNANTKLLLADLFLKL